MNFIDSLVCERISTNEENRRLVYTFLNPRNPVLADMLQKAWDIDAVKMLKKKAEKANDLLLSVKADIEREEGTQVHQVSQTYPSIEIENFCTIENAKTTQRSFFDHFND